MATFFDITSQDDVDLLHASVRKHTERDRVINAVEVEILNRFTIRTGVNAYRVELEGYDDTTPASSHATLKAALKRAIAAVASHRLRYYDRDPSLQIEELGDYKYDRGSGAGKLDVDWPASWDSELTRFYNERPPLFHI